MLPMPHASSPHILDLLGAVGGALGLCIAIYLQLVTRRKVPVRYVLAFFVVGSLLLSLHAEAFPSLEPALVLSLRAVAIVGAILLELGGAWYVWKHAEVESPVEVASDVGNACREWWDRTNGH